jgi:hypothetical protein
MRERFHTVRLLIDAHSSGRTAMATDIPIVTLRMRRSEIRRRVRRRVMLRRLHRELATGQESIVLRRPAPH